MADSDEKFLGLTLETGFGAVFTGVVMYELLGDTHASSSTERKAARGSLRLCPSCVLPLPE